MPPHTCCMLCISVTYTQGLVMHICEWLTSPCCHWGTGLKCWEKGKGRWAQGGIHESYAELYTLLVCTLMQRLQATCFTRHHLPCKQAILKLSPSFWLVWRCSLYTNPLQCSPRPSKLSTTQTGFFRQTCLPSRLVINESQPVPTAPHLVTSFETYIRPTQHACC